MEHRGTGRTRVDVSVRFAMRARAGLRTAPLTLGTGRVINISAGGAFLDTQAELPLRSVIYLEAINGAYVAGHKKRLCASVVRRARRGVGLEWCKRSRRQIPVPQTAPRSRVSVPPGEGIFFYQFDFLD
jgi:hypothetical protein